MLLESTIIIGPMLGSIRWWLDPLTLTILENTTMSPEQAISSLPDLIAKLDALRNALAAEAELAAVQWQGLGRIGGQRADHAASLMKTLKPHLDEISRFAGGCSRQIDIMMADPFGRRAA